MRRYIMMTAAAAAVATLAALSPAAASAASHAARAGSGTAARAQQGASGARLWVRRYNGPGNGDDDAASVAVRGTRVFVTGGSPGKRAGYAYATVAYSAATGKTLWVSRYSADIEDYTQSMAVNAAGTRVFVTGMSYRYATGYDYATVAYNGITGRQLWARHYNGPANGTDGPLSVAVNPRGTAVYVTGLSDGRNNRAGCLTVAYSAATGKTLWVRRHTGPGTGGPGEGFSGSEAFSVAVNPRGTAVFVTGSSGGGNTTVAYGAATGRQLWVSRYVGSGAFSNFSVAVNPAGTSVYVTAPSDASSFDSDYATVAYSAATGKRLWARRYNGPGNSEDGASSLAVNARGTRVYVTGYSTGRKTGFDYAAIAYNAATGKTLWVRRYNGPANRNDGASSVAVSPRGPGCT